MAVVYVSSWGSHATPGMHGPGRKWTIMAIPRGWERGEGSVDLLVPRREDVIARHADEMSHEDYVDGFIRLVAFRMREKGWRPEPGALFATVGRGRAQVADGDTLCCGCGRDKAARGRCHRSRAAAFLALAGWDVVLDGRPLGPTEAAAHLREGVVVDGPG